LKKFQHTWVVSENAFGGMNCLQQPPELSGSEHKLRVVSIKIAARKLWWLLQTVHPTKGIFANNPR